MPDEQDAILASAEWSEIVRRIRARTPGRILVGRTGAAYRTNTQLELREAHAAARDAVRAELNLETTFGADFVKKWGLFEVCTQECLSAYMAYRPQHTHSDAERNLISNIHARGANPQDVAARIVNLAAQMMKMGASGYTIREGPSTLIGE